MYWLTEEEQSRYLHVPGSENNDILAEERAAARGRLRLPRFEVPVLGALLRGRSGIAVLALFVLSGLAYGILTDTQPSDFGGPPPRPSSDLGIHAEAGRPLTVVESVSVQPLGEGLYLGPSGLPVVRHEVTGEVREVTPLELEFLEEVSWSGGDVVETGRNNVVWSPGPAGYGMYWQDDTIQREIQPDLMFTRYGWRNKQEDEIRHAAAQLSYALREVERFDITIWQEGPGASMYYLMSDLRARYPVLSVRDQWGLVPVQWICSEGLESQVNGYITSGCPVDEYVTAVDEAWFRIGVLTDHLLAISKLALLIDPLDTATFYESRARRELVYMVGDLLEMVEALNRALLFLRNVSTAHGMPINVNLFEGGI